MKKTRGASAVVPHASPSSPVYLIAPADPDAAGRHSWACPPDALFDLWVQYLHTKDRLVLVERVCGVWRGASVRGGGWGHSLDLLALPPSLRPRAVARAWLGPRLRPARLRQLSCDMTFLTSLDPEDAASSMDGAKDQPVEAREAEEWTAFPACDTLVLGVFEVDRVALSGQLSRLDIETAFPRLRHLDVVADADVVAAVKGAADTPTALELAGGVNSGVGVDGDDGDAAGGACRPAEALGALKDKRVAWMSHSWTSGGCKRALPLPRMSQIAHLRLSGRFQRGRYRRDGTDQVWLQPYFQLRGELKSLRSLQTLHDARVELHGDVALPCLTHLAIRTMDFDSWKVLLRVAGATLVSLFAPFGASYGIHNDALLCPRLHTLHLHRHNGMASATVWAAAALPLLRDIGIYRCADDWTPYDPTPFTASSTLASLTIANAPPSRAGLWAESVWTVGVLPNAARTRFAHYGPPHAPPAPL